MMRWLTCSAIAAATLGVTFAWFTAVFRQQPAAAAPLLLWFAPFVSGGGYSSEAIAFAKGLSESGGVSLAISQHGDAVSRDFIFGLSEDTQRLLGTLFAAAQQNDFSADSQQRPVVVCHSEPGAWFPPLYETQSCPPPELVAAGARTVGRTMSETDGIPDEWVRRCNAMDAVWVPTEFHREVFIASGVNKSRVFVVPEPVDTAAFAPAKAKQKETAGSKTVRFLSVGKFEERKAFDVLVRAFTAEFTRGDAVQLIILTSQFHHEGEPISALVQKFADSVRPVREEQPEIVLLQRHIPDHSMPELYASVNALVVPSKGEGWGRPHIEAMSCGLPVVATNWSGPTAFMNEANSFPLRVESLVHPKTGPFRAFRWAQPSEAHLRELLRFIASHPEDAAARGRQARKDVEAHFSPAAVAEIVKRRISEIPSS